ncbi:MAG: leucine-rich repeat protein [Clostridia bacterium]|nr:leucine-rich repeat protein [Clostridia bacterium]
MKKIFPLIVLIFLMLSLVCACELPGDDGGDGDDDLYRVMLSLPEGVSVDGSNPVRVRAGETARFKLKFENDTMFASVTHGKYNYVSQTVTIDDVKSNINATLAVNKYDFDTSVTYNFIMRGTSSDQSTVASGTQVNAGIVVEASAGDEERRFVGWSFGNSSAAGAEIVSTERSISFVISAEYANSDGNIVIYANYTDTNVLYYHPNGGQINIYSANYTDKSYYKATLTTLLGDRVMKLKVSDKYLSKVESYSSLYDDGTFYRKGYVLKEYNTKADGTGEAYSLGSKVYFDPSTENPTLYCIWAEETPADAFTYTDVNIRYPYSKKSQRAPDWKENGVIISSYTGNAETVVIPEKIGDKYVIAIGAGAFKGKDVKTVVFNRFILRVADGAFRECSSLETLYLNDGINEIGNGAFDTETYSNFKSLIVNATIAPRFSNNSDGAHAIKMSRLLAGAEEKKLIVVGGSSIYEGLGTEYLEALLDGEYRVVNFGTTRTTHGTMYLEAMSYYASEGDVIIYAPENSSYMLGERELYWKTLRDLEGMNNIYRHVDISQYTNVFGAFSDFNQNYRYVRDAQRYESIADVAYTDENGDHTRPERESYVDDTRYLFVYYPSLNNRTKSRFDVDWMGDATANKEDYNNPNNTTWCSIDDPYYLEPMNRVINAAKSSGAKVYFGYCPCDADSLVNAAKNYAWLRAYDELIADIYDYDGVIGKCESYIYNHVYFFDCAFHLNDYGRTYRTYQLYLDLCDEMGVEAKYQINSLGTLFDGCKFEPKTTGKPKIPVDYLTEG